MYIYILIYIYICSWSLLQLEIAVMAVQGAEQAVLETVKSFILTEHCEKVFLTDFDFFDGMR